jgi:4-carboxymuconolactone decarboxylase
MRSKSKLLRLAPLYQILACIVAESFAVAMKIAIVIEAIPNRYRSHAMPTRNRAIKDPKYEAGLAVRRRVLGDAHVKRALENATEFDADFQEMVTRNAWGDIWTRPGLDLRTCSIIVIAILAALGRSEELDLHVRATRNTGATADEVKEVLLQVAVYAGMPAANSAFRIAKAALAEITKERIR